MILSESRPFEGRSRSLSPPKFQPQPLPKPPAQKPPLQAPQAKKALSQPQPQKPPTQPQAKPLQQNQQNQQKSALVKFNNHDLRRDQPPLARGSYGIVYTGQVPGISQKVIIKDMTILNQKSIEDWRKEVHTMAYESYLVFSNMIEITNRLL